MEPTYAHPRAAAYAAPGGPWDVPTLDRLLTGADAPGPLVVDDRVRLDAAGLRERVGRLAAGLRTLGAGRGDVVAWQLPNGHEALLLYRACWRIGAIAAPVHHRAGPAEAEAMLRVLSPRAVLAGAGSALLEWVGAVEVGSDAWDRLFDEGSLEAGRPDGPDPADLAVVLFTSGSAGTPKAVLHSHRALAGKAATMVTVHGLGPDDAVLMPAPLAHVSGLLNGVLVPGAAPFATVLMDRWDPGRALELIEAERVTFMVGPPTFFVGLMDAPGFSPVGVDSLRLVSSGGAGVTAAFVDRAATALGCRVKRTYGSTEAPTVATSTDADPPARAREHDGRAVGAVELRITDPATGEALPAGRAGELWVQGPELFCGYADPDQTAAAVTDGWFRTGDLATVDDDGWLTVVGRLKDVIIRGGENVAAAEVEGVLEAHPAVREAVAVGIPDETMGERVCAYVVVSEPFDLVECRRWFEASGVARFKTPERVVVVGSLPVLASGKPDRAALRAAAAEGRADPTPG